MSTQTIARALPAAQILAAVATSQIFSLLNAASGVTPGVASAAILNAPGSNRLNRRKFTVRASGIAALAAAGNLTVTLYAAAASPVGAASLVPANWTALCSTAATAVAGAGNVDWELDAEMLFSTDTGKLSGCFESFVNSAYGIKAAITGALANLNANTEPCVVFAVGLTFSVANAANVGTLSGFVLDA